MPIRLAGDDAALSAAFTAIRAEIGVTPEFPPEVLAAADAAVRRVLPPREDLTALPFFTIDPPGSTDLDQAMCLERDGTSGFRVRYAIADVPAFVPIGGVLDAEARRRGVTVYAPDLRSPLHPPLLGDGAASLLPDVDRPAFVWDLRLDADGEVVSASVARALVRSRARLDYEGCQRALDGATAPDGLRLLTEVGERRVALERARGGAELPMPEQEIEHKGGAYALRFRPQVPTEDHNAQISLMTGMAAARMMLDGGVGLLRTMPPPGERQITRVRLQAQALGTTWPDGQPYGEFLRGLDLAQPSGVAIVRAAASLFRGAGYVAFDGAPPSGADAEHAGVAAPYTHVTAPLRRLVDRFGLLVCAALCAGEEVPAEVRGALADLPDLMRAADRRAGSVERACLDAVEAAVLVPRVGETWVGVVVDTDEKAQGGEVQLSDPAVIAKVDGDVSLGARIDVRLVEADLTRRSVRFVAV